MTKTKLKELVKFTALAKVEEQVLGIITPTQMFISLWFDLNANDQTQIMEILREEFQKLATKISKSKQEKTIDKIINYANLVLQRCAMLADIDPQNFGQKACGLKDILLEAVYDRMNSDAIPGTIVPLDNIVKFVQKKVSHAN